MKNLISLLAGGGAQLAHGKATTFSWKPNLESVGVVGGTLPSSLTFRAGTQYSSSQPTNEPPKTTHHVVSKRVTRKVQRIPPTSATTSASGVSSTSGARTAWSTSGGPSKPPGAMAPSSLITTSSWRAGKKLADKILKGEGEDRERCQTYDYRSDDTRRRREKEGGSPQHSFASESESHLGSSLENISGVSSSIDLHVPSERGRMDVDEPRRTLSQEGQGHGSPSQKETEKTDGEEEEGGHRVALDVAGLLEDMESPIPPEGGRERGNEREKFVRTRSARGGPSSKKPRYNVPGEYEYGHSCTSTCTCALI